jgi:hypothetical protein
VKNSTEFINIIKSLRASPEDILVSFDVVSLFTMVPIFEALRLLSRHFDEDIPRLFRTCTNLFLFRFNGQFYKKTDGVAMCSPRSTVIAGYSDRQIRRVLNPPARVASTRRSLLRSPSCTKSTRLSTA